MASRMQGAKLDALGNHAAAERAFQESASPLTLLKYNAASFVYAFHSSKEWAEIE